jgi:hypothetical protein
MGTFFDTDKKKYEDILQEIIKIKEELSTINNITSSKSGKVALLFTK